MSNRTILVHCVTTLTRHFVVDEGVLQTSVFSVSYFVSMTSLSIYPILFGTLFLLMTLLYISRAKHICMERQLQLVVDKITSWCDPFFFLVIKTKAVFFVYEVDA